MSPIDTYIKEKRLALSSSIKGRKIVYLDINYWIRLREENKKAVAGEQQLLTKVLELSDSKRCIFPISEITFWEIMKQSDLNTRKQTIELVDRLSEGVAIITMKERAYLETRVWFLKTMQQSSYDIEDLVWAKLAFILGYDEVLELPTFMQQKSWIDYLDKCSLLELAGNIQDVFSYKDNVQLFNENFKKYAHENKTEEDVFLSELAGYIEVHSDSIKDVMASMYFQKYGRLPTDEERGIDRLPQTIYNLIRLGKITNELPIFHIVPKLYAWCRWIKKPFKDGNDTLDFYHASFALPYCDYFLTDRRTCSGIKQTKLDQLYNCRVEHNPDDALALLNSLNKDD